MSKERDYDYVFGKLPRKDKDGKDTTGDKIRKGGRHRNDGTFSSMAYDLEVVDRELMRSVPLPPPKVIVQRETIEVEQRPVRYEDLSVGGQIFVVGVGRLVEGLFDYAMYKIISGIDNWFDNRRRRREEERIAQRCEAIRRQQASQMKGRDEVCILHQMSVPSESTKSKPMVQVLVPDEFDSAYFYFV